MRSQVDYLARLSRAQYSVRGAGLSALLVSPGLDLRYLTGYDALPLERLTCLIVPAHGAPSVVAPLVESSTAAHALADCAVQVLSWLETEDPYRLVASLLPKRGAVAVDDHMWAEKVFRLGAAMPRVTLGSAGQVLSGMRMRKTEDELAALRSAAAAVDSVHARMGEWLRVGRTERAVANDIREAMLRAGHASAGFVVVASGPNGARPHHEVSDRVIQPGDPVVVDIGGAMPSGYWSDSTRTYMVGAASHEFLLLYGVLQEAQRAACIAVFPGTTAGRVDDAARSIISAAGFGDHFVHRTGHGIGMDVHEEPYIVAGSSLVIAPGMAFTVEPGIYIPGRYGARIEDVVVCNNVGAERLNSGPRELVVLEE